MRAELRAQGKTYKNIKNIAIASLLAFSCASTAYAQSFEEALSESYINNPELLAARARLRTTDENVPYALSGWRPTVEAQAEVGKAYQKYDTIADNLTPADAALTVTQPVYSGGGTVANTKAAEESVRQERAQLEATEQDVLAHTAAAYLDILRDQEILKLYDSNLESLRRWRDEMRQRQAMGEKTLTDVGQAEARLARAEADRANAAAQLGISRSAYARYVGQQPGVLVKPSRLPVLPLTQEDAMAAAQKSAPAVEAATHAAQAGKDNIKAVRARLLPSVALQGTVSTARDMNLPGFGITQNRSEKSQVLLQLRVPLYEGGANYTRLRAAYQDHTRLNREKDAAAREAVEAAARAWDQTEAASANISSRKAQVIAAQVALEGMRKEERVGDRSSTDTLNAEQELLEAQTAVLQAEHDYTLAAVQLLASVGGFTAKNLGLGVKLYDPEKHYNASRRKLAGLGDVSEDK